MTYGMGFYMLQLVEPHSHCHWLRLCGDIIHAWPMLLMVISIYPPFHRCVSGFYSRVIGDIH